MRWRDAGGQDASQKLQLCSQLLPLHDQQHW
jgi:hypothetical protein